MGNDEMLRARTEMGKALRKLRGARAMTDVAAVLGWSQAKISRIETARTRTEVTDIERLLDAYEVGDDHARQAWLELARAAAGLVAGVPDAPDVPEPAPRVRRTPSVQQQILDELRAIRALLERIQESPSGVRSI